MLVGGVDGAPTQRGPARGQRTGGWVMAVTDAAPGSGVEEFSTWWSFADLWSHARERGLVAVTVDIPVGLPAERARRADFEARRCLKGPPNR